MVGRLLEAKTIFVLGMRSAAPLAQFFGYYLHFIFDDVRVVAAGSTDVFESIARIKPEDVLVGISFPRYSTRTLEAMRFAHDSGAQVIGLTDGPMSPLHQEADNLPLCPDGYGLLRGFAGGSAVGHQCAAGGAGPEKEG